MNSKKETITITLPKRLADKLREIDRLIGNDDIGQTLAETCGWRIENLTDPKPEEIIDLIDEKRWRSRSACEKAKAVIAVEFKDWPIEIEKGQDDGACASSGPRVGMLSGITAKPKGWTTMRRTRALPPLVGPSSEHDETVTTEPRLPHAPGLFVSVPKEQPG
jgi:hypothetical protein